MFEGVRCRDWEMIPRNIEKLDFTIMAEFFGLFNKLSLEWASVHKYLAA